MQRQKVKSSDILSIGYSSDLNILEIEFIKNGKIYQYLDVPENIFLSIMSASSHGRFFNRFVKNKYKFRLLFK